MPSSPYSNPQQTLFPSLSGVLVASLLVILTALACLEKQEMRISSLSLVATQTTGSETDTPLDAVLKPPQVIEIELDFDEQILWNDSDISPQVFRHRLEKLTRYAPKILVDLRINRLTSFGNFFRTINQLQQSGIETIKISRIQSKLPNRSISTLGIKSTA